MLERGSFCEETSRSGTGPDRVLKLSPGRLVSWGLAPVFTWDRVCLVLGMICPSSHLLFTWSQLYAEAFLGKVKNESVEEHVGESIFNHRMYSV